MLQEIKKLKFLIFGGTFEGRQICQFFTDHQIPITVSVATEYGRDMLTPKIGLNVHVQRLDKNNMINFIQENTFNIIIDATHPYAVEVGKNISEACKYLNLKKIRILRKTWEPQEAIVVNSAQEAADFLNTVNKPALLAAGSKELAVYTKVKDFQKRLFARVLPDKEVVAHCQKLGFSGRNLICMQGPFSKELNIAMLKDLGCYYLLSKDSGDSGGFMEKLEAVQETKGRLILIRRPINELGLELDEALKYLDTIISN